MKKQFFVGLFLTFNFLLLSCLYAGWPINRTPKIEGTITDATTGKPIENVVVSAEWVKRVPTPVDSISKGYAHYIAVTDKEGRYVIPAKTSIHMLSSFYYLSVGVLHPLYETKGITVMKLDWRDLRKEHKQYDGKYGIMRGTSPIGDRLVYELWVEEKGIIHYDVQLLSLEEKDKVFSQVYLFKKISGSEGIWAFGFNEEYFNLLSKTKKTKEFDLDRYFGEIYEGVEKFKNHQDYESAKKEMQEREKKIRAIMGRSK